MTQDERNIIIAALDEDTGAGDPTSEATVDPAIMGNAYFLAKANGVLSGMEIALEVFGLYAERSARRDAVATKLLVSSGNPVTHGMKLAFVNAPLDILLGAERVALNFLQRMSGIATMTKKFVDAVAGTNATIIDTRKTAPLLRPFDRAAVRAGGGTNNRYSLGDMILVKDNHIAANGGDLVVLIEKLRNYRRSHPQLLIELEVTTLAQFETVLERGVGVIDRVMFDNFPLDKLAEGVKRNVGTFETEASGGVNLSNVRAIAETGVDLISVGSLTHSVTGLDISLEIE
ncbi:MAG: carboxylating nicotinate-nucleotide diphosphorylase [Bacteroidetes bacterium]|nr:carboxylating nicotinate-nucleotide diphosphorylase [Bacteroidota bacterium]